MAPGECRSFAPDASGPPGVAFVLPPVSLGARPRRSGRIRFAQAAGSRTAPTKVAGNQRLGRSRTWCGMAGSGAPGIARTGLSRLALRSFDYSLQQFVVVSAL